MSKPIATTIAGLLLCLPGLALAQQKPQTEAKESCTATAAPPPELAGWNSPTPVTAARRAGDLSKAALVPGRATAADFHPVDQVEFRVAPAKADGPPVYGGLYSLKITQAGTYRLAANAGPWMDIFPGTSTTPVTSIAHGHGPACTGVGKEVDFSLQPGDYLVQFSENLAPKAEIMLGKLPQ